MVQSHVGVAAFFALTGAPASAARRLRDAGCATAAFVGADLLDRRFGLADDFDHDDDQILASALPGAPERVAAAGLLRSRAG